MLAIVILQRVPDRFRRPPQPLGQTATDIGRTSPIAGQSTCAADNLLTFHFGKLSELAAAIHLVDVPLYKPVDR